MPGWIPAFLIGMASAVVLETGLGLLLFLSPGLLPALTGLLSVGMGAYALGLGSVRGGSQGGTGLRWRWILTALGLMTAAVLSLGWSFQGAGMPATAVGRGAHMTLLLVLPLYGLGACLGGLVRRRSPGRPGAAPVAGAAAGVTVLGMVLFPRFEPFSVYLFCLMCVALAALGTAGTRGSGRPAALAPGGLDPDPWALETLGP